MKIVVFDAETFFDSKGGYTLKKMSTEFYIRDPRFITHGAAVKWSPNHNAKWYDEKELQFILRQEDWSDTLVIAHHMQFDGLILSHHYDVHPAKLGCTLSMARLLLGNHLSVSLDSVRKHYGMPGKKTPYHLFDGKHWNEIELSARQEIAEGACDEVESIWTLFNTLLKDFPREELSVVDTTMKMFTEPVLRADVNLLAQVWEKEEKNKQTRMAALGVTATELQSADKFAELLRAEGVDPEYKQGKNGPIYSFAKTDDFMRELLEDEDERIRTLAEARLGIKSTLVQTRAETIGWMARRGLLCVYLRYAGAHTSRWSGGDGANWQNGVPAINEAILPPEGYYLAKPDASQIECRLLNFLAGQEDKIEDFRQGRDPYVGVAEAFCGHPVNKTDHPDLRQMGKVVELQAGYGSGGKKIKATIRNKANIVISLEDGEKFKKAYRETHPRVVDLWKQAGRHISCLADGEPREWGPTLIKNKRIWLPNGIPLVYELEFHRPDNPESVENEYDRGGYWRRRTRKGWEKMYGAKLVENWIQGLARVAISQAMIRIVQMGYRVVNMRHDDLWILIPRDGQERQHLQRCLDEISRTPKWLPGIPLAAEGFLK